MRPGHQRRPIASGVIVRSLLVFAFAVVAFFASRSAAAATSPIDVVESVGAVRVAERPQAVASLAGDGDPDAFEEALDDDGIDDDDVEGRHGGHVSLEAAVAIAFASSCPRKPALTSRTEAQRDPSRFAIGHGFARGPPY